MFDALALESTEAIIHWVLGYGNIDKCTSPPLFFDGWRPFLRYRGVLLKWDRALGNFAILLEKMTAKVYTRVLVINGYGWNILKNDTLNVVFLTGYVPGYISRIDRYPDLDLPLIMRTNQSSDRSPLDVQETMNLIFITSKLRDL